MNLYEFDPLTDGRWGALLERNPGASVFHSPAWLEALHRTYGYSPVAYTTSPPRAELESAMVFCQIDSWLTGKRLVSLPFSDHCEPLAGSRDSWQNLCESFLQHLKEGKWRYIEIRPLHWANGACSFFRDSKAYCFHQLDLSPDADVLFHRFHKDSTQRKIRRAEREGLAVEEGRSHTLLDAFYDLQLLTRRRHGLPPQPRQWFRNLADCFGEALTVSVAYLRQQPAAAILTLRFKDALVYKYGCSDPQFHRFGAMHLLFWKSIQNAKLQGLRRFDLGRSDLDNAGLVTFKDRWGAERSTLTYGRYPPVQTRRGGEGWKLQLARQLFRHVPDSALSAIGDLVYKHLG